MFEAAGGGEAMLALAHAWHERCLADPIASHPFERQGHPQHLERLAAYWGEALGGPPEYSAGLGDQTTVLQMHAGNGVHEELDRRAVACFDAALDDVGLGADERLRETLSSYFRWQVEAMAAHPDSPGDVPLGLDVPQWSWDGPVDR